MRGRKHLDLLVNCEHASTESVLEVMLASMFEGVEEKETHVRVVEGERVVGEVFRELFHHYN